MGSRVQTSPRRVGGRGLGSAAPFYPLQSCGYALGSQGTGKRGGEEKEGRCQGCLSESDRGEAEEAGQTSQEFPCRADPAFFLVGGAGLCALSWGHFSALSLEMLSRCGTSGAGWVGRSLRENFRLERVPEHPTPTGATLSRSGCWSQAADWVRQPTRH